LGPGDPVLLTRQAWELLEDLNEIYLRTSQHPAVAAFPPGLQVHSFDPLFETTGPLKTVSDQIVTEVLALGRRPGGVVYAVPGHPFIAEATAAEIARRSAADGIPCRVVQGLSFLEPAFSALGIDPFPRVALIDALELAGLHVPPFPPSLPALVAQVQTQAVASQVKQTLQAVYPGEHPVQLIHLDGAGKEWVEGSRLSEIDESSPAGLPAILWVPPLGRETSLEAFQEIIAHLRAPDGCPWDREQTHDSLRPYLLEESYEVLAALDSGNPAAMREEFGDLLLQIVLHAQIAAEAGEFNMTDILSGIHAKIVKRHPHVFGDVELKDAQAVLQNWERLKEAERNEAGKREASIFDGVARALPALSQAEEIQRRAARVKFDWPDIQGVLDKVHEELGEVQDAGTAEARAAELGDLSGNNLARWYGVDAESVLREMNTRFRERFAEVERSARQQGRSITDFSMDEMEDLWQSAKKKI
jgi:tetrapyrrole methylase family protein/MazG family protein